MIPIRFGRWEKLRERLGKFWAVWWEKLWERLGKLDIGFNYNRLKGFDINTFLFDLLE